MNEKMKNLILVVIAVLLVSACGPLETASTPAPMVTSDPVEIENPPTAVPATGLSPEKFSQYLGLDYPPLPGGLTEIFSMLIQDANDHSLWLLSEGENKMLWLGKLTHHDSSGNAYWEVKDILDLSNLESGVALVPDGCLLNGEPDNEILTLGQDGVILLAWRANTTLDAFEVIPTNGIECHSDKGVSLE